MEVERGARDHSVSLSRDPRSLQRWYGGGKGACTPSLLGPTATHHIMLSGSAPWLRQAGDTLGGKTQGSEHGDPPHRSKIAIPSTNPPHGQPHSYHPQPPPPHHPFSHPLLLLGYRPRSYLLSLSAWIGSNQASPLQWHLLQTGHSPLQRPLHLSQSILRAFFPLHTQYLQLTTHTHTHTHPHTPLAFYHSCNCFSVKLLAVKNSQIPAAVVEQSNCFASCDSLRLSSTPLHEGGTAAPTTSSFAFLALISIEQNICSVVMIIVLS